MCGQPGPVWLWLRYTIDVRTMLLLLLLHFCCVLVPFVGQSYSRVRGMQDWLPGTASRFRYIVDVFHWIADVYHFSEVGDGVLLLLLLVVGLRDHDGCRVVALPQISTPIVEGTPLYERGLGASSDVVNKVRARRWLTCGWLLGMTACVGLEQEMFTFPDKSGKMMTLRPENTASVVRAVIGSDLAHSMPQRLWYYGPMFRYERPQRGRHRQFHQFGTTPCARV